MKTNMINPVKWAFVLIGLVALTACEYKEIIDDDIPASEIYLPAATNGFYRIDELSKENLATPTPGSIFRYVVNIDENKFDIPLSVYRSGVDIGKTVSVDTKANSDTIQKLINDGLLAGAKLLPADKYSLDANVSLSGGKQYVPFNLGLNLKFLKDEAIKDKIEKDKALAIKADSAYVTLKYAIAVQITTGDPDQQFNPDLCTVIIVVDTRIFTPIPLFRVTQDGANSKKINFLNDSEYGVAYNWNFGDGKGTSTKRGDTYTYAAPGLYPVKLEATGLYNDKVSFTQVIGLPIAKFSYAALDPTKPRIITFTNESSYAASYLWSFEKGTPESSKDENPVAEFKTGSGPFEVTLKAIGNGGIEESYTLQINL